MPFGTARGQGFNSPSIINFQIDNVIFTVKGLFVYSTNPPALGTLKFSVPFNGPGTDKSGNAYLDGATWYTFSGGTYYASQLFSDTANGASVRFYTAPAPNGPWTQQGIVQVSTAGVLALGAAASIELLQPLTTFATVTVPGGSGLEGWHTITLDSGWTTPVLTRSAPRYKFSAADNKLLLNGAASAAFFSGSKTLNNSNPLPAIYRPANPCDFYMGDVVGSRCHINIATNGVITANAPNGVSSGTLFAEINGIVPLD